MKRTFIEPRCRGGKPHPWTVLGMKDNGEEASRCGICKVLRYTDPEGNVRYEDINQEGGTMSCTSCGNNPETVGEVKGCTRCQKQGITRHLQGMEDGTPLATAVDQVPSLANRFVNTPRVTPPAPPPPNPRPATKPKASGRKATAKKAPAKKKRR